MYDGKRAVNTADQYAHVRLVDDTDHVTPEASITSPTLTASKNGGSFASLSDGTWTNLGGGWYSITLDATDTNTVGLLDVKVVKAGCDTEIVTVGIEVDKRVRKIRIS